MKDQKPSPRSTVQMVYGVLLALAGVGIFVRFDQVVPQKLSQFQTFASAMGFIRFCFYLMAVILIGGGVRKIANYYKSQRAATEEKQDDTTDI